mmetsp:Transcript_11237/g.17045  ORF Transcript_11237/g.17045 Transcript_11237/m.17045 type:complete len:229 (-) Transcript_11237:245-931(-)
MEDCTNMPNLMVSVVTISPWTGRGELKLWMLELWLLFVLVKLVSVSRVLVSDVTSTVSTDISSWLFSVHVVLIPSFICTFSWSRVVLFNVSIMSAMACAFSWSRLILLIVSVMSAMAFSSTEFICPSLSLLHDISSSSIPALGLISAMAFIRDFICPSLSLLQDISASSIPALGLLVSINVVLTFSRRQVFLFTAPIIVFVWISTRTYSVPILLFLFIRTILRLRILI